MIFGLSILPSIPYVCMKALLTQRLTSGEANRIKERQVRNAIRAVLEQFQTADDKTVETILELAKNQNEY